MKFPQATKPAALLYFAYQNQHTSSTLPHHTLYFPYKFVKTLGKNKPNIQKRRERERGREREREMRCGRSSSKQNTANMDMEKSKQLKEPHLSGAYIRSLVKQLSSTKPKDVKSSKPSKLVVEEDGNPPQEQAKLKLRSTAEAQEQSASKSPQPQPAKKQVRRRLHTSRPYQERLLNMAEARREIVTALKFHRAAMKQAKEQQQQQIQQQQQHQQHSFSQAALLPSPSPLLESPHELVDSKKNFRMYPSNCSFPNYLNNPFSTFSSPFPRNYPGLTQVSVPDNLNLPLPNQPLGLSLNFQSFSNVDAAFCNNNHYKPQSEPTKTASSSSTYSYHSPTSLSSIDIMPSVSNNLNQASHAGFDTTTIALHPVMDDEGMAEIRTIGERHDLEWNDTMNLVTSAWWSKFLKSMEDSPDEKEREVHGDEFPVFDEIYDIPSWLSDDGVGWGAKEGSLFQQNLDKGSYEEDYQHDAALPCLDIGEIEGWEWLSRQDQ